MFGSIPLMAAPIAFKQSVAHALENEGVPMAGSAFGSGAPVISGAASSAGSATEIGSSADGALDGGASLGRGVSRRLLAMVAGAAAVVIALSALMTGRASTPSSNEVVAIADSGTRLGRSTSGLGGAATTAVPGVTQIPGSGSAGSPSSTSAPLQAPTTPRSTSSSRVPPSSTAPPATQTDPSSPTVTQTTPPVTVQLRIYPDSGKTMFTPALGSTPTLDWSVNGTGVVSVTLSGPGFSSAAQSGSVALCPGSNRRGYCFSNAGTYTYSLDVFGTGGELITSRSATLTIY